MHRAMWAVVRTNEATNDTPNCTGRTTLDDAERRAICEAPKTDAIHAPATMEPRQWPAIIALILAALAQRCRALAFTTDDWTLERGKTMNITWSETGGSSIGMSVYYTRTIPGRFEPRLTIDCTSSP